MAQQTRLRKLTARHIELIALAFGGTALPATYWRRRVAEAVRKHGLFVPKKAELEAAGFTFVRKQKQHLPGSWTKSLKPFDGYRYVCIYCGQHVILPSGHENTSAPFCSPLCAGAALADVLGAHIRGRRPPYRLYPRIDTGTLLLHVSSEF